MSSLVVIGAGPAGESAARAASKNKISVQIIEKENLGGLCLNRGCIPSKTLLSFGKKCFSLQHGIGKKFFSGPKDLRKEFWQEIRKEKDRVVQTLRESISKTIHLNGIQIQSGSAKFISPKELEISSPSEKKVLNFEKAVIAVGSHPIFPPPLDEFKKDLLDSDRILELDELPLKWLIVGGGAVGCEYACLLQALGCEVTLLEMMDQIIPGEDPNISNTLRKSFEKRGVKVLNSLTIQTLSKENSNWNVTFANGSTDSFNEILVCGGRRANVEGLDLEKAGIKVGSKGISVDETLATSNPNVFAIGDVNGLSLLAHAGSLQGEIAARNALPNSNKKRYDGRLIPRCLYTWPEVASVGLWLSDTKKMGIETKSQRFFFEGSARALAEGETEGFLQIISEKENGKILGAQMIGPHVTEIIHILSVALSQGLTRENLREVIFAHPTLSEGIRSALER